VRGRKPTAASTSAPGPHHVVVEAAERTPLGTNHQRVRARERLLGVPAPDQLAARDGVGIVTTRLVHRLGIKSADGDVRRAQLLDQRMARRLAPLVLLPLALMTVGIGFILARS